MTREEVYALIDAEREYQKHWDEKRKTEAEVLGGAQQLDKDKPVEAWILWMENYLLDARTAATKSLNKAHALEAIRKVTALGVACMEYNDTKPRVKIVESSRPSGLCIHCSWAMGERTDEPPLCGHCGKESKRRTNAV